MWTRSSASRSARTTMSPSPSTPASSWRASAPCCAAREVTVNGRRRVLTHHEFELLATLARAAGRVLSRAQILEALKGQAEAFDRSIDVHVAKLRAKLEADPKEPRYIKTVRGVGYMLAREAD